MHDSRSLRQRLSGLKPEALMAHGLKAADAEGTEIKVEGVEIEAPLGRGGMGTVYLGRQVRLDREVAVKVLARELANDPLFLERLEREARVMARLRHPNIVAVHDFHRDGESAAIVMELVEGGTLRDKLRDHPNGLPVDEALRMVRQIAAGLTMAHAEGVIHRDMKPENVLIAESGEAMVSDFGLAMPMHDDSARLTLTGMAVGTVDYMAPEQFKGTEVDVRIDIYALGVIAYELLTGQTPRGSFDPPHVLRKEVSHNISTAVMQALRPRAQDRFASVNEFILALEDRAPTQRARWPWLALLGFMLIATAWWVLKGERPSPNPGPWRDAAAGYRIWEHTIRGNWQNSNGVLTANEDICIASLEADMPEAYDVRVRFSRLSGMHSVAVFFRTAGQIGSAEVDAWNEGLAGVQEIAGQDLQTGYGFRFPLFNGRTYEMLIEIRPDEVRMSLDGEFKKAFSIKDRALTISPAWEWDTTERPLALGIGCYKSPTRFDSVEWREVPLTR
ncbi:MAG: serine/threonine protein kinase [Verrucomicrobiaceae bacterium]|nr:serine/threonine protein kinase [Verrucomicrobiaceae bacterium]